MTLLAVYDARTERLDPNYLHASKTSTGNTAGVYHSGEVVGVCRHGAMSYTRKAWKGFMQVLPRLPVTIIPFKRPKQVLREGYTHGRSRWTRGSRWVLRDSIACQEATADQSGGITISWKKPLGQRQIPRYVLSPAIG